MDTSLFCSRLLAIMSLPFVQVIRDRNNIIAILSTQVRSVTFMRVKRYGSENVKSMNTLFTHDVFV